MRIHPGCIVALEYSVRLTDGRVVESSAGKAPLEYLQGAGQILPALEKRLEGLEEGDRRQFVFQPDEAFGQRQDENVVSLPKAAFPSDVELKPGARLAARNSSGQQLTLTVQEIRGDTVVVDFNHPLAGQTLFFTVSIRGVRPASDDERFIGKAKAPVEA